MDRRHTKKVKVGDVIIGGDSPISVQTMTNTDTSDVAATLRQISEVVGLGAELVRVTVNNEAAAMALKELTQQSPVPIIADIHFDYRLAIKSIENGVGKIRINPHNIGSEDKLAEIVKVAKEREVAIRVGSNSGSVEAEYYAKYGNTPKALVESALARVRSLEKHGFDDIVISVKCSDVQATFEAYRLLSTLTQYPLHIGVTEAGFGEMAVTKSAIGIGSLLLTGIGDTIRVSITGDPSYEVKAANNILKSLGLYTKPYINLVVCPTCGRTEIPVLELAEKLSVAFQDNAKRSMTVAVMGCIVNGLGEGKEADYGVAGGKTESIIFAKGEPVKKVKNEDILTALLKVIESNG